MPTRPTFALLAAALALGLLTVPALAQDATGDPGTAPAASGSSSAADSSSTDVAGDDDTTGDDPADCDDADDGAVDPSDDASDDDGCDDAGDTSDDPDDTAAGSTVTVSVPARLTIAHLLGVGRLSVTYTLPDAGTITAQLFSGAGLPAPTATSRHAVLKILGTAHRTLFDAGTTTVPIRLGKRARAAIHALHRATKVQLRSTVKLEDGTIVKQTKTLTLTPPATAKH